MIIQMKIIIAVVAFVFLLSAYGAITTKRVADRVMKRHKKHTYGQ